MTGKNIPTHVRKTTPRRKAFAIAKVKERARWQAFHGGPQHDTDIGREVTMASLGVVFCVGAIIGISGFLFLVGGLIKSGGITEFVKGWLAAFNGI